MMCIQFNAKQVLAPKSMYAQLDGLDKDSEAILQETKRLQLEPDGKKSELSNRLRLLVISEHGSINLKDRGTMPGPEYKLGRLKT